jgi:hypothetical protein
VAVPPRATGDVMAGLAGVAGHNILDGAREDVSVMRKPGGEGRSIVEGVFLRARSCEWKCVG